MEALELARPGVPNRGLSAPCSTELQKAEVGRRRCESFACPWKAPYPSTDPLIQALEDRMGGSRIVRRRISTPGHLDPLRLRLCRKPTHVETNCQFRSVVRQPLGQAILSDLDSFSVSQHRDEMPPEVIT